MSGKSLIISCFRIQFTVISHLIFLIKFRTTGRFVKTHVNKSKHLFKIKIKQGKLT